MKILMVTNGFYPDRDAGSTRVTTFAKLLKKIGHEPVVVGYNKFNNYAMENIDCIDYISILPRMRNFKKSIRYILENEIIKPDIIWIYWAPLPAFLYLKKYCIKKKILLIHDSVEWFSANGIKDRLNYFYLEKIFVNKYVINKNFKVICISSYLQNYFSSKKIDTIRIPILMDVKNVEYKKENIYNGKIRLLYAGSPNRSKKSVKDDLEVVLRAMIDLPKNISKKFSFTILGINTSNIKENYNIDIDTLGLEISALGRVSRQEVLKYYNESHFTILIRDSDATYAKAGFPTKAVESLMTGTPIICNLSSDLGLYLKDKENSIIVLDNKQESVYESLLKIANLSYNEMKEMSKNAYNTALNNFDYRLYANILKEFLEDIRVK